MQETTGTGRSGASVAGQAKEMARTGTEQMKELGSSAKERARREIDSRRERLASEVEKLAGVLENQRGESEVAGPLIDVASSAARRLSSTLRERSADDLLRGLARSPGAILAGSFAIGFLATRLFKE